MSMHVHAMVDDLLGEDGGERFIVESVAVRGTVGGRHVLREIRRREFEPTEEPGDGDRPMRTLLDYFEFTIGTQSWVRLEYLESSDEARK